MYHLFARGMGEEGKWHMEEGIKGKGGGKYGLVMQAVVSAERWTNNCIKA